MTKPSDPVVPVPRTPMTDADWLKIRETFFVECSNLTPSERFARAARPWETRRTAGFDMDGPGALDHLEVGRMRHSDATNCVTPVPASEVLSSSRGPASA